MRTLPPSHLRALALASLLGFVLLSASRAHAEPPPAVPGVFTGESGGASVSHGLASASFPMPVMPGRAGMQPSLVLRHSAGGSLGNAGIGMHFAMGAIERHSPSGWPKFNDPPPGTALTIDDHPPEQKCIKKKQRPPTDPGGSFGSKECVEWEMVPGRAAVDLFTYGGEPLVPICSLASPAQCPSDEAMPAWASANGGWHYFRLQHDTFQKFFWHPLGNTWRIVDKSGVTTELGEPLVAIGVEASAIESDRDGDKPYRWLLSRQYDAVRDSAGEPVNVVAYRWGQFHNRRKELVDIFYTPAVGATNSVGDYAHHIHFEWEHPLTDTYKELGGRDLTGVNSPARVWRAQPSVRLAYVDMTSRLAPSAKRELVRRFNLTYHLRGLAPKPYLVHLQMDGRCKGLVEDDKNRVPRKVCSSLPYITLSYSESGALPTLGKSAHPDTLLDLHFNRSKIYDSLTSWQTVAGGAPFGADAKALDITGDGIADIVNTTAEAGYPSGRALFVGTKTPELGYRHDRIFAATAQLASRILSRSRGASHIDAWSPFGNASVFLVTPPETCDLSEVSSGACLAFKDDPILAVERVGGSSPTGPNSGRWEWTQIGDYPSSAQQVSAFGRFDQLGDVDGDGLADRRYVWNPPSSTGCEVSVLFGDRDTYGTVYPARGRSVCGNRPDSTIGNVRIPRRSLLADMNADGVADLVVLWDKWQGKGAGITYFLGDGTGDFGPEVALSVKVRDDEPLPVNGSSFPSFNPNFKFLDDPSFLDVTDVNGDGYADIVVRRVVPQEPCSVGKPCADGSTLPKAVRRKFGVWLNMGGGLVRDELYLGEAGDNVQFADFNGNGTTDIGMLAEGGHVRFLEFRPGQPENLLVGIDNGLGHATTFSYESTTDLDAAANPPWTSHCPRPTYVVTSETAITTGVGDMSRKQEIRYAYSDPAWDGARRALRGFTKVRVTAPGDDHEPTSIVDTAYHFSACHRLPRIMPNDCKNAAVLRDDADDTHDAWPMTSQVHDEHGTTLSTTFYRFAPTSARMGMDRRTARFSYVYKTETYLGSAAEGGSSTETRSVLVRDASPPCTETRFACPASMREVRVDAILPGRRGRVHLQTRQVIDPLTGNVKMSADDGRTGFEGGKVDEPIVTETEWEQVSAETNWLYRPKTSTVKAFAARPEMPRGYDRRVDFTNNSAGKVTDVWSSVDGALPLARRHEDPARRTAPTPAEAVRAGAWQPVHVAHFDYDAVGNVWRTTTPASGGCADVLYDDTYKDHGVLSKVYTEAGCAGPALKTVVLGYDRGFGVATLMHDDRPSFSSVELDSFGRVVETKVPDPRTGDATRATTTRYLLNDPNNPSWRGARVETTSHLGEGNTHVSWVHIDGTGAPVLSLSPGDAPSTWIASGLPVLNTKGHVFATYEPWLYAGEPETHPLTRDPSAAVRGHVKRDAFGRTREVVAKGKTQASYVYGALDVEVRDAESRLGGLHPSASRSAYRDGHGRTERIVARGQSGPTFDAIETNLAYQATGELARIEQTHDANRAEKIVRWMQHDSLGRLVLNAEPNTAKDFTATPTDAAAVARMRTWRYAYDAMGRLVGTSDARGCGKNLHYDVVGRLVAEDYSPCLKSHEPYTEPERDAAGKMRGTGTEVFHWFDPITGQANWTRDRGAWTILSRDYQGRVIDVHKRIAKPVFPLPAVLHERYAPWVFTSTTTLDFAGRTVRQSSGADAEELLAPDAELGLPASDIVFQYGPRGNVSRIGSSYGTLMKSTKLDPDGFVREMIYGDKDDHDAVETKASFTPDDLRRLKTFTLTHPYALPGWQAEAPHQSSRQVTLAAWTYERDGAGNVLSILDGRDPREWPDGAKPVNRAMVYDDFYRLTDVSYKHASAQGDVQAAAFAPGALPVGRLPNRVQMQHFEYGWQGNTTRTTADAAGALVPEAAFFDRSLSTIKNGDTQGGHPNQLNTAGPYLTNGSQNGVFTAYDDAGNMTSLLVARSACKDTAGMCNHAFAYDWDEVGQLTRARRWDKTSPRQFDGGAYLTSEADVDLQYAYSGGARVRKTATVEHEQRHTVDVFPSLRLKNATWNVDGSGDYEHTGRTEQVYLGGLAHVTVFDQDVAGDPSSRRHVLLTLGDELGSASVIVDKKTGELVQRSTYQVYGAPDSDYRPDRWGSFREDFRFTGKEDDAEVGLTYFGARYYHAQLGRWLSADPLTVHAAGSDLNPYAYVRGSPTNLVDPTGLDANCTPGTKECAGPPPPPRDPHQPTGPPPVPGTNLPGTPDTGTGASPPPGNNGTDGGRSTAPRPPAPPGRGSEWVSRSGETVKWNPYASTAAIAMLVGSPTHIDTAFPIVAGVVAKLNPVTGAYLGYKEMTNGRLDMTQRVLGGVNMVGSALVFAGPALKMVTAGASVLMVARGARAATAVVDGAEVLAAAEEIATVATAEGLGSAESLAAKLSDTTHFHYTDANGFQSIMENGAIRANAKNQIFLTQDMLNQEEAFSAVFAGNPFFAGKGSHVIAIDAAGLELRSGVQVNEAIHAGTIRLDGRVLFSGPNPF